MDTNIQPYSVGPVTDKSCHRLHLNEFRQPHHPNVLKDVREFIDNESVLTEYPAGPDPKLIQDISCYVGAPPEWILAASGSDEILRAVIDTSIMRKQTSLIIGVPTYTHFTSYAKLRGLKFHEYSLGVFDGSVESQLCSIRYYDEELRTGSLVYIGNPNNPLGEILMPGDIIPLALFYPKSLFIVDEAYIEFASAHVEDSDPKVQLNWCSIVSEIIRIDVPNIIVTRTFSKALGLAAMRVGYGIASPKILDDLRLAVSPKALGSISTCAARSVLAHIDYYAKQTQLTTELRIGIVKNLENQGWLVIKSDGNFILVYCNSGQSATIVDALEKIKIYVRDRGTHPGLDGFLRITIGSAEDNAAVCTAFKEFTPPENKPIQYHHTPKQHIVGLKWLMKETLQILKCRVVVWLEAGTLFGWLRHRSNDDSYGGIIPTDDDIDLGYFTGTHFGETRKDPFRSLIKVFAREELTLQRNRTDAYWQVGTNKPGTTISKIHIDIFPFHRDKSGENYICADPRFREENPDSTLADCNTKYRTNRAIKENKVDELFPKVDELFPLQSGLFYDMDIMVPHLARQVIMRALGDDCMEIARVRVGDGHIVEYKLHDKTPA